MATKGNSQWTRMVTPKRRPRGSDQAKGSFMAMNDPFAWSLPLGRLFGVTIRVHWLFPFVAIGYVLHGAWGKSMVDSGKWDYYPSGAWVDACVFMVLLFVSVLFHEYG